MVAPPPKAQFESQHFTNNQPETQRKLDACLAIDPAHIFEGQTSPEVAVIQAALGQISEKLDDRIPKIADSTGHFGGSTRAAVSVYKHTRDIRLEGHAFDDIVGRRTISFLDTDMVAVEGGKPAPPPLPTTQFKDVVVQILGFGGRNSSAQGQRQGSRLLRQTVASGVYASKTDRSLDAIVFTGGQQPDPTKEIAALVRGAVLGFSPGLICLTGESAGGKNVLALASDLANSSPQLNLTYVGISDGAFFDEDAVAPPNFSGTNLEIRSGSFAAREKVNIFQSAGNGTEFSIRRARLIWAGKMPNKEVHGPIQGFSPNRDLTAERVIVPVGSNTNFEVLHANAADFANGVHLARIKLLLDSA